MAEDPLIAPTSEDLIIAPTQEEELVREDSVLDNEVVEPLPAPAPEDTSLEPLPAPTPEDTTIVPLPAPTPEEIVISPRNERSGETNPSQKLDRRRRYDFAGCQIRANPAVSSSEVSGKVVLA